MKRNVLITEAVENVLGKVLTSSDRESSVYIIDLLRESLFESSADLEKLKISTELDQSVITGYYQMPSLTEREHYLLLLRKKILDLEPIKVSIPFIANKKFSQELLKRVGEYNHIIEYIQCSVPDTNSVARSDSTIHFSGSIFNFSLEEYVKNYLKNINVLDAQLSKQL